VRIQQYHAQRGLIMTELEALIQHWKDYRCDSGLRLDEFEKVNNTIIYLETLQRLVASGFVSITEGGVK